MTRSAWRIALLSLWPAALLAQTRTMNVGDATLRYELSGSGPVVVLIHGWAQDLEIWDEQVAALSPDYRVLRYDRRGYGRSTGHADPTADPDDLRILLDRLGIRTATVLGLSAGAGAALTFGVAFPDRTDALILYGLGPPAGFYRRLPPIFASFRQVARDHGLDSLGKLVLAMPLAWRPPNRPDLDSLYRRSWARYEARDLLDPEEPSGRVTPARVEDFGRIRVPTLLIHGDHEMPLAIEVADTAMRRLPNARRIVIADGGHGAHFAQPARFNAAVREFLATVYGGDRRP
jgi:pimeloyl-ACP methyl ester carboxylesterase